MNLYKCPFCGKAECPGLSNHVIMADLFGKHGAWLATQQYPSCSQDCAWHRRAIDELIPLVEASGASTAIELGAGEPPSYGARMLKRCGLTVTTVDMAAKANMQADIHDLPFPDGTFDLALARHSLEHCVAPLVALREARRVARWLVAVVPEDAQEWLYWGGHFAIFPRHIWEHLFRLAGWSIRYYEAGDFSPTMSRSDIEWRWLLERGPEHCPPREANGHDLGRRYPLASKGWQDS